MDWPLAATSEAVMTHQAINATTVTMVPGPPSMARTMSAGIDQLGIGASGHHRHGVGTAPKSMGRLMPNRSNSSMLAARSLAPRSARLPGASIAGQTAPGWQMNRWAGRMLSGSNLRFT